MSNRSETTLSRSPEARGFRVEQILEEAKIGRLRIPLFQRPLRWKSRNVIDFFDSVRRGFPVGDLLFSREHAKKSVVNFGPVVIDADERGDALFVIDGQQRVTALIATLLREDAVPSRDYWAIWYDLEKQKFVMLMSRQPGPALIPLNVLSDSVKQLKWIRNWPLSEEREDLVDRALGLGKSIREYEIPAYIVEGADEQSLRLIFTRLNTGGINMRESEIFEALYGSEGEKPIRSAIARLSDLGFGQLDEDLFLRCLRVTCNVARTDTVEGSNSIPPDAIRRTERALRLAIHTISIAAGIPHWKLMPYRLPLILLTVFYDKFPAASERVGRLVAKWIWRGALSGDHEIVTDARVARLSKQIRMADSPDVSIMELLAVFADRNFTDDMQNSPYDEIHREIRLNRASGKIFVLSLLAANPSNPDIDVQNSLFDSLATDDEDPGASDDINGGSETGLDPSKISRSVTKGKKFGTDTIIRLPNVQIESILDSSEDVLGSYLLTPESVSLLREEKIEEFRSCREAILREYFVEFLKDRVGDRIDLRPSIKSIISSGDHPEKTETR